MRRLLIRPGGLGDIITSLPALECLRSETTEIWAPSAVLPLLTFAGARHSIASTGLDLLELGMAPEALRGRLRSFDSIVSWYGTAREEFRSAVADLPFTFFPALPPGPGHAVDFYLDQARTLGAADCAPSPSVQAQRWDGGFAVIHPFSGSARKNWSLENFREVASRLKQQMPVHWCAGPEELLDGAVRFDDLGELAQWLAGARLYLGNDSGITHLAAAVGVPVVAIFQASDPRVWAPRGENVKVIERPAVEDVLRLLPEADR